jgi:hypothetical protein
MEIIIGIVAARNVPIILNLCNCDSLTKRSVSGTLESVDKYLANFNRSLDSTDSQTEPIILFFQQYRHTGI